jgi:predicted component of type VI protein secretion system
MIDARQLNALEDAIRRALGAGSCGRSQELLEQYRAEVERLLRTRPISSDEVAELETRTHALLAWMTIMAHGARARLAARASSARAVRRYGVQSQRIRPRGVQA